MIERVEPDWYRQAQRILERTRDRYPWTLGARSLVPGMLFKNYVQTTLAAAMTNVATTATLTSVAGLPTTGTFRLRIDDVAPATTFEIIEVASVNVGTGVVTMSTGGPTGNGRGMEGTTGIAHSAGAIVGNEPTAGMLNRHISGLYRFKARNNASTSFSNVAAKIALQVKDYDPNGMFDNVTNFRGTIPAGGDGLYLVIGKLVAFSVAATHDFTAMIYKNGVELDRNTVPSVIISSPTQRVVGVYLLAAGDYLELWAQADSGSAASWGSAAMFSSLEAHCLGLSIG